MDNDYIEKHRKVQLPRFGLDVLIHRRVIFVSQIEVVDWPSSYLSSADFRKFFYSILINKFEKKINTIDLEDSMNIPIIIQEYLRFKDHIKIYEIEIDFNQESFSNMNNWLDTSFILKNLFKFNDDICTRLIENKKINLKLKYFFATIYYWLKWSQEDWKELFHVKNENCKRAFIVALIKSKI